MLGDTTFEVQRSRATEPLFFHAPVPPGQTGWAYQHAGVEYALARRNCLIGDAPGVGKTIQAIMISNAIAAEATLVVCPGSLRRMWEKAVWKWTTIPNVNTYCIRKSKDGVSLNAHYVIISYDLLRNPAILSALMARTWDHMILDEGQAIKDPAGNKRSRPILAPDLLPSVVGRITMLTGTPIPNGQPSEVYNACRLLDWDTIDRASLETFKERYYDLGEGMVRSPVWDEKIQANVSKLHFSDKVRNVPRELDDLQLRLRKHIMVRRLKEDVLKDLPPKTWSLIPLETTPDIRAALRHPGWGQAAQLYDLDPSGFNANVTIDGEIATARRLLGEAKAPGVATYIEELLDGGVEKVVVSAWHNSVMEALKNRLGKHGMVVMDAKTSTDNRERVVERFQSDPRVRVFLGQMQVAGVGHTLTAASHVVLGEPSWVPGDNLQMSDRCHRPGQRDAVTVHVPVVPGHLDERIIAASINKDRNSFDALDRVA